MGTSATEFQKIWLVCEECTFHFPSKLLSSSFVKYKLRQLSRRHFPPWRDLQNFTMRADCRQRLGLTLAIMGFLGTITTCALPSWKVTAFIGSNNITAEFIFEGLWMYCVVQSTGQIKCKVHSSDSHYLKTCGLQEHLSWSPSSSGSLQSCLVWLEISPSSNCGTKSKRGKYIAIASGVVFIIAGIFVLIAVCWSANTIMNNFYKPFMKMELGTSLYIGWTSAGLLRLGGGLLCSSCPPKGETKCEVTYSKAHSYGGPQEPRASK